MTLEDISILTVDELRHIETRFKDTARVIFENEKEDISLRRSKPKNYLELSSSIRYQSYGNDEVLVRNRSKSREKTVSKLCALM